MIIMIVEYDYSICESAITIMFWSVDIDIGWKSSEKRGEKREHGTKNNKKPWWMQTESNAGNIFIIVQIRTVCIPINPYAYIYVICMHA